MKYTWNIGKDLLLLVIIGWVAHVLKPARPDLSYAVFLFGDIFMIFKIAEYSWDWGDFERVVGALLIIASGFRNPLMYIAYQTFTPSLEVLIGLEFMRMVPVFITIKDIGGVE